MNAVGLGGEGVFRVWQNKQLIGVKNAGPELTCLEYRREELVHRSL